jgi:hypothetical protein
MPRPWSTDLQNILKSYRRRDTLDIYLNNGTTLRLSRGKVIRGSVLVYDNWIRSVDELRFSTESSIDRITITCQNVNSTLGFNLASNLRLLDYALADYGKIYESLRIPGLKADIEQVFRGVLANAESDEQNISFELIVDYESLGAVVASRALSPRCWWTYKNGVECTSTSGEATCPQTRSACVKRGVEKDFGGWEAFIEPVLSPPGSGGNDGGGIGGGGGPCFTLDTPVWTPDGDIPIGELRVGQRVVSFNERTGEVNFNDEIIEVLDHETTGYYTFEFEHGLLNVTPEHPLLVANNIFVLADMFQLGDTVRVVKEAWEDSALRSIRWNSDAKVKVRNLHVRGNHTYFANRCGVHNVKPLQL